MNKTLNPTKTDWQRVREWSQDAGIPDATYRMWKSRGRLPDTPTVDLLADETYRRYGLRKADVLRLAGRGDAA